MTYNELALVLESPDPQGRVRPLACSRSARLAASYLGIACRSAVHRRPAQHDQFRYGGRRQPRRRCAFAIAIAIACFCCAGFLQPARGWLAGLFASAKWLSVPANQDITKRFLRASYKGACSSVTRLKSCSIFVRVFVAFSGWMFARDYPDESVDFFAQKGAHFRWQVNSAIAGLFRVLRSTKLLAWLCCAAK
jgi:hypothetical protein